MIQAPIYAYVFGALTIIAALAVPVITVIDKAGIFDIGYPI